MFNAIIDPDIHPMAGLSSLDCHHWTGVDNAKAWPSLPPGARGRDIEALLSKRVSELRISRSEYICNMIKRDLKPVA